MTTNADDEAGSRDAPRTAGIILIGDELLSGKVRDTNGQLLIEELRRLGVQVRELHVIGDEIERIVEALELVRPRNDVVFTSGGIGPTHDDKTMAAVAAAFGVELVERPELVELIVQRFGDDPSNPWLKMGSVPAGCELIFHAETRWPVYRMANVYVMPGIPEVFRRQFDHLRPQLCSDCAIHLKTVYVRRHEGFVARVLNALTERFPGVAFGSYPVLDDPEYEVRITVESRDEAVVLEATGAVVAGFEVDAIVRVV